MTDIDIELSDHSNGSKCNLVQSHVIHRHKPNNMTKANLT